MSFTESRGTTAVVTGSEARFSLEWEGEGNLDGREVIVWLTPGAKGFYAFPAPSPGRSWSAIWIGTAS